MKTSTHKQQLAIRYSEFLDRSFQIAIGKFTNGLSPAALMLAFFDWYFHLLIHPQKQIELLFFYQQNLWQSFNSGKDEHIKNALQKNHQKIKKKKAATPPDNRFAASAWQRFPYHSIYHSFLLVQKWWHVATSNVRGTSKHHQEVVDFVMRQILDMLSPSNSIWTNPEVLEATIKQHGGNFVKGIENFFDDMRRYQLNDPPAGAENYIIGKNIAITPGKVIYRNHLMELIQYAPTTETVYAEPVLITPAWIMKYYILDLSPKHSLVKYLVNSGHTVFIISWKNPREKDRNLTMGDYLELGIMDALRCVSTITPKEKIHLVGYCLGGTLAAIAAATMARDNCNCLESLTLLAAQTDFTEPGELGLFIDESQISFLENIMREKGFLDTTQMAGAFQLLRSNDLIWSRMIRDYLLGERKPLTDLMAWNADATRLPYKMHSEYLRQLFLNNNLAAGKYLVKGQPIALTDITVPIFAVATERDHVSPWHSVFKLNLLTASDVTFTLTSGGHNVGIVSIPVKYKHRSYRIKTLKESDRYIDAENWYKEVKPKRGSWWPAFENWLAMHSSKQIPPPSMGSKKITTMPLEDAPGKYVLEK